MKLGLGLYRHMLTPENFKFARQAGATHIVAHWVDYFHSGPRIPQSESDGQGWGIIQNQGQLWSEEELTDLRKAVELLPEAQREVIILRFASGLSIADTARALGKQENNVKVLQHKGMQRLQILMTPKYPEIAQRQS